MLYAVHRFLLSPQHIQSMRKECLPFMGQIHTLSYSVKQRDSKLLYGLFRIELSKKDYSEAEAKSRDSYRKAA